jgi:MiaB-like tRNA modifying enzyme
MKAYLEAYGCTLNVGESREARALLARRGWDLVDAPEEADLAVLVTCVVIEKTEREMLKRVKALSGAHRLVITGCMATACRGKAEEIAPEAEFVPPGDLASLSAALDAEGVDERASRHVERYPFSIVPISTGCLGRCSYCMTQLARGQLKSRPIDAIVQSVEEAVSLGPTEVQLTAQDTAAYGSDIDTSLSELIERVCEIPGDFRVRVGMMNPKSALQRLEDLVRLYSRAKVFKFLHLPVQSGSDSVLGRMSRGYTVGDFEIIVSRLRGTVPELTLSTDLIVGYPGETEEDHAANLRLISRVEPDIVNVTRFSERPGTAAAGDPHKVAGWKAKYRSRELTRLRFSISLGKNREWVGRKVRALSTEPGKPGTTIFRTDEYKQIVVPGRLELGAWSEIRVTGATATYLKGLREGPG